jgi:hypothetical protein
MQDLIFSFGIISIPFSGRRLAQPYLGMRAWSIALYQKYPGKIGDA